jgi:hypothetical protein
MLNPGCRFKLLTRSIATALPAGHATMARHAR